ncbi:uncharacterized protein LOC130085708 [Rhinichthys klamathensis goyatoka]|uniref:uncharacterized protein LOC130085708 n=1 Tax=Rhinichthys klamathensis goyatoka TaxID=3034132 RepID=UPI0024B56095|nr:uncharacterized protein LOC130085708 [Rhinichthys klamathensis goyatoka]
MKKSFSEPALVSAFGASEIFLSGAWIHTHVWVGEGEGDPRSDAGQQVIKLGAGQAEVPLRAAVIQALLLERGNGGTRQTEFASEWSGGPKYSDDDPGQGQVEHERGGFGLSLAPPKWHKAGPAQRRKLVVNKVRKQEERMRCIKAISQAKQGEWMRWESVEQCKIGWQDLWSMEESRISFLIRSTYDVLPSPQNLNLWVGEDPSCPLCSSPATLRHILTGCKVALSQGRFKGKRNMTNKLPPVLAKHYTQKTIFLRPDEQPPRKGVKTNSRPGQLDAARDWKMLADLDQRLIFPPEIATTNLRPDIVLWSGSARIVQLIELTVPWEDAVDEAYERKKLRYAHLATEAEQRGWRVQVYPVEVGCRGFVAHSTTRFLRDVGFSGQELRRTVKNLSEAAERKKRLLDMTLSSVHRNQLQCIRGFKFSLCLRAQ